MTTTAPVLKVEIAFATAPLNTLPTWTDVTSYVRLRDGVDIRRGRNDEFTNDTPGTLTLTLANRDRRFDPLYAAGAYNPNVLPGKAIRATCTFNGTTYDLFYGFIEGWPQAFARGGMDATVTITAVDALGYLATAKCTNDPYYAYLASVATIQDAYRQSDGLTWTNVVTATNGADLIAGTATTATSSRLADGSKSTALDCTSAAYRTQVFAAITGTLSFWIKTSQLGTSASVLSLICRADQIYSATIGTLGINNLGQLRYIGNDYIPGAYSTLTGLTNIADGNAHHVVIVEDYAVTGCTIYVDGKPDANVTSGTPGRIAAQTLLGGDPAHINFSGTIQDMVFTSTALTAAQVATLYAFGIGRLSETSVARLTRLCDDAGLPSAWRSFSATPRATVSALSYIGQPFVQAARDVETSEQGRLFSSRAGTLTFYDRYAVQEVSRCSTSQLTFSDTGAAGKAAYSSFGFRYDTLAIQNDITVRSPDAEANSQDATAISAYGRQSEVIDTALATPAALAAMAAGLVYQRKDPQTRTPPMEILLGAPQQTTAVVDKLLALELHDQITAEMTPMKLGAQISLAQQVEQIAWSIDDTGWTMTLSASPVKPGFFLLGTSTLGTDRLGY